MIKKLVAHSQNRNKPRNTGRGKREEEKKLYKINGLYGLCFLEQLILEFNDGSGAQVLSAVEINSVPFALEAASISGMPLALCGV